MKRSATSQKTLSLQIPDINQFHPKLGEILLSQCNISRWQLAKALEHQNLSHQMIGHILIQLGYINYGRIEDALSKQTLAVNQIKISPNIKPLGTLLLESGRLTYSQLEDILKEQHYSQAYLGDILVSKQLLTAEELDDALTAQVIMRHSGKSLYKKLGELLIDLQQISKSQLDLAMRIQQGCMRKLGDILVSLRFIEQKDIDQLLRIQKRLVEFTLTTTLGVALLTACGSPPHVPLQAYNPTGGQFQLSGASTISTNPQTLSGEFKILQLPSGQNIKIFQNGSKILDSVPFIKQGDDRTCGQAVMTMVLNYWGVKVTYQELVNKTNRLNWPTSKDIITNTLRQYKLNTQDYRNATIDNVSAQINKGRPVIVLLDFGGLSNAHYVVVVGYNKKKGTLILNDSLEGPYIEMEMAVFNQMWLNRPITALPLVGGDSYKRIMFDIFQD